MSPTYIAAIVDEVMKFCRDKFDALDQRLDRLGLPEKGEKGDAGVGIKALTQTDDLARLGIEFDDGSEVEVLLPPGPKGEKGDPGPVGEPGAPGFADPVAVADILQERPAFLKAVQPEGQRAEKWVASIYRAGSEVTHYMGRVYVALKDTTEEPGDSDAWERIGSGGWRHTGGYKNARAYEAGDLYVKDGATWIFDGERPWLMAPKPYTDNDADKAARKAQDQVEMLRREFLLVRNTVDNVEAMTRSLAERLEGKL